MNLPSWITDLFKNILLDLPKSLVIWLFVWGFSYAVAPTELHFLVFWICFPVTLLIAGILVRQLWIPNPVNPPQQAVRDNTASALANSVRRRRKRGPGKTTTVPHRPIQGLQVLAVASGKGGVGKTLLASGLAESVASMGQKVLLLDLDFFNRGLTGMVPSDVLGGQEVAAPKFFNFQASLQWTLVHPDRVLGDRLSVVQFPDLDAQDLESASKTLLSTMADDLEDFIREAAAKCNATYVVLDCHGGPDPLSFAACSLAQHVVLVSEPDEVALHGLLNFIRVYESATGASPSHLHLVYNKVPEGISAAFLRVTYARKIESITRGEPRSLQEWLGGNDLLTAIPLDTSLVQPRPELLFPTLLNSWCPLAHKCRAIVCELWNVKPEPVLKATKSPGRLGSLTATCWEWLVLWRKRFMIREPYYLDSSFYLRIIIAVVMLMAAMSLIKTLTKDEEAKLQGAIIRMATIRLTDYHGWPEKIRLEDGEKGEWNKLADFATGEDVTSLKQLNDVMSSVAVIMPQVKETADGKLEVDASPEALAGLKETLGSLDVIVRWQMEDGGAGSNNDDPYWDYALKPTISGLRDHFLQHRADWRPKAEMYRDAWAAAAGQIESTAMWKVRLARVADRVAEIQNRTISLGTVGAIVFGCLLLHRAAQRRIAIQLVRGKPSIASAWVLVNILTCLPLVELLRFYHEDSRLGPATPFAPSIFLIAGLTLAGVVVHQFYQIFVCCIEGRGRREVIFRTAALILFAGLLFAAWAADSKLFPGSLTDPS